MRPASVPVRRAVPWNPLACSDTPMRPNALLMAKLSWLLLVIGGYWQDLRGPFSPSVGLLDAIPDSLVSTGLTLAFWIGGLGLLFNRAVRIACVLAGGAVLLAPFQSLTAWHPYSWVCAGVLVLCALQISVEQPRFVRGFVVLVHIAALLGATRPDGGWVSTALAAAWSDGDFLGAVPRWLAEHLPTGALALWLHRATLVVCAIIPVAMLIPRTRRAAAMVALLFYVAIYLALGVREVALFAGAIAIAQIACLDWPRYVLVVWPRACGWPGWLRMALDRFDFERRTDWPRPPDPDAELEAWFDVHPKAGARAVANLVLFFPAFYFTALAVFTAVHAILPPFIGVPVNSAITLGLISFSVVASLGSLRARIIKRPPAPGDPVEPAPPAAPQPAPAPAARATAPEVIIDIDTPPPSAP